MEHTELRSCLLQVFTRQRSWHWISPEYHDMAIMNFALNLRKRPRAPLGLSVRTL